MCRRPGRCLWRSGSDSPGRAGWLPSRANSELILPRSRSSFAVCDSRCRSVGPRLPCGLRSQRLSQTQRVAIFLDRRLDPQRPLELRLPTLPLGDALEQLAQSQGADISFLPPVVYLGPQPTTRKLATVWELGRRQLEQVDRSSRRRWQSVTPTAWPLLSEPRQLVAQWTRQRGVVCTGVERIPHDLWAAQQLPPLDLLQQLTIVLAGFDLSVALDSRGQAQVVPMPEQAAITQNYKLSDAQWARWPHWSTSLTGVVTQRAGSQLSLTGRIEDHRQLASWLQGQTAAPVPATQRGEQRYTLTVQNQPRERVLDSLTRQLDLELQWDGVGEVDRSQRVSLQLQNATLDELLRGTSRRRVDVSTRRRLVDRVSPRAGPAPRSADGPP